MYRNIFLLVGIAMFFTILISSAQSVFVRQNVNTYVYSKIDSVFLNAQDGDTIYLPGGNFHIGSIFIDKSLRVIGAGHFPDSTTATYPTQLNGHIYLLSGSSYSFFSGFFLNGNFYFGTNSNNNNADHVEISRCRFYNIILNYDYYNNNNSNVSFVMIKENYIMGDIIGMGAQHVIIEKNLINGAVSHFVNGNLLIKNNTFLGGSGCPAYQFSDIYNSLIQNNIIMNSGQCGNISIGYNVNSCIFEHNVFNANYIFPVGSNAGINNYVGVPFTNFFVNEVDFTIDYQSNYHLQQPGLYLGSDGTQVGIYGTTTPFKEGSLPVNPHVISKNIAPQTDINGNLQIQITVNAQQH